MAGGHRSAGSLVLFGGLEPMVCWQKSVKTKDAISKELRAGQDHTNASLSEIAFTNNNICPEALMITAFFFKKDIIILKLDGVARGNDWQLCC